MSMLKTNSYDDSEEEEDEEFSGERRPLLHPRGPGDPQVTIGTKQHSPRVRHYNVLQARLVTSSAIMLCGVGLGPFMSVLPQYLEDRLGEDIMTNASKHEEGACNKNSSDPLVEAENKLQSRVTTLVMYYTLSSSIPATVSSLLVGAYSDYIGRRFTLCLPVLCSTAKLIVFCCIVRFRLDLNLFYLVFGLDGVSGGWLIILMATYTITADIHHGRQSRVLWITIVTALGSIMAAASNITSGYMIKNLGFFPAALFLMSAMALTSILTLFFLPETLPPPEVRVLNVFQNVKRVFGFFIFDGTVRERLTFFTCLTMFFFAVISDLCVGSIDPLYQIHEPFCWGPRYIGYYNAFKTGGMYLVGILLMKVLQYCFRHEFIGMFAVLCQCGSYILEAFAKTTWQLFLVPAVGTPGSLITPVLRAMMSLLAGPTNQGALFTSICVFESLCSTAAATVFNKVYGATVGTFPGAVYLCMASFSFVTFLLFFVYFCLHGNSPTFGHKLNAEVTIPDPVINGNSPDRETVSSVQKYVEQR